MPVRVSSRKRSNAQKYGKAKSVTGKSANVRAAGVARMKKASARRRSVTRECKRYSSRRTSRRPYTDVARGVVSSLMCLNFQ